MKRRIRNGLAILLAAGLVPAFRAVPPARAAEPGLPPLPALEAGRLEPGDIAAGLRLATRERFPDADAVYADGVGTEFYREDGTGESWSDVLIAVLTEKGRRDHQSLSFGFHEAYGDVAVLRLELHKPDGRVIEIDVEAQSRVMVSPGQMASNIFDPRQKVLQVGVPGLEPGDGIRAVIRRRETKTRMPDFWGHWAMFESAVPILRDRLEVYAPDGLPLRHRVIKDGIPGTVAYEEERLEGWTRHRWTAREVPQLFEEPNMPPRHTVAQRLLLSTLDDWPAVSRWYWNLCEPRLDAVSPEMIETTGRLTAGLESREEQIRAVFRFVSQQIRYMGITPEEEAPGYEPHDVRMTFENRYGVCRDKAALLAAMLRLAGFEAFPVLIDVGPKKDLDVPLPYFNHAITAVREPDGSYRLMDPTDETTRDLLPAYLGNRSFLVATPEGEALLTSPVPPAGEHLLDIRTEARLLDDGRLIGASTLRFEGINDNAYRGFLARLKPGERRRFFESLLVRAVSGARMTGWALAPADLQDTDSPLVATLRFEAADLPLRGREAGLLPLPWFGTSAGMVNFVLGRTGLPERRFPLLTDYACGVRETFGIELPPDFAEALSLPESAAIRRDTLEWSQAVAGDRTRIEGRAEFLIHAPEFSPARYLELKQDLRHIESEQRRMPGFRPPAGPAPRRAGAEADPGPPDVRTLRDDIRVELLGPGHWRTTRSAESQILTYAGARNHAEIQIPFQPAWESARVPVARVANPDGSVREAGEMETHLMDAAWVAGAPRYPPARILVVNLPGVEIGSRIEVETVREFRDRPFVSGRFPLLDVYPADRRRLSIEGLDRLDLRWSEPLRAPVPLDRRDIDGRVEWSAAGLPAAPREESMPPLFAFTPAVFFSDGDWPEFARTVDRAWRDAAADQPRTIRQAADLLRDLPAGAPDSDRVRAIRDFVETRIRKAGPAPGALPWTLVTPADRTLEDGYGNSADRAILLFALLRAAGFEPRFVLAADPALAPSILAPLRTFPQEGLFTAALVAVDLQEGVAYLNDSSQYAPLFAVARETAAALDLSAGAFLSLDAPSGAETVSPIAFRIVLDDEGHARMTVSRGHRGMDAAVFRRRWAEMTPELRRRYMLEEAAAISQNAELDGEWVPDPETDSESFALRIERFAVRDGDRMYLTLPMVSANVLGLGADRRRTPLHWSRPLRAEAEISVRFPRGMTLAELVPEPVSWESPCGSARGTFEVEIREGPGLEIVLRRTRRTVPGLLEPADYPDLFDLNRRISHPGNRTLMVRAPGPESGGPTPEP